MDQRPHGVQGSAGEGAHRPHPLGSDPVGQLAERHGQEERDDASDGEAERPTCAADSPTIWVKKTALPVRNVPSPIANSTDCTDSFRASGVGGSIRESREAIPCILALGSSVRRVVLLSPRGGPDEVVDQLRGWLNRPDDVRLCVETSGSTGTPKRVVLSRAAVLASGAATERRLGGSGRWVLMLPPTYVAGVQVVVRSLVAGRRTGGAVAGRGRLVHLARADPAPPAPRSPATRCAARAMHTILLGGGPIDPALRLRASDEGLRVVATYGASETAGGCVYDGVPLDGVAVGTERADQDRRAHGVRRVRRRPRAHRATLVDGWFLTADAGRLDDDGRLQVLGRLDDVVISGGVNVPLPAVAERLREHPAVEAVEVLGVPDDEWGSRVVAFVVGRDEDLRGWVRRGPPALVGTATGRRAPRAPDAGHGQGGPRGPQEERVRHVFSIPLRTTFRGITLREGMLLRGDAGWGEWSPFLEYDAEVAAPWLKCALEAADGDWPTPLRDAVPVNVTVPACSPERAHEIVRAGGCTTAKVKVAERGQTLADDHRSPRGRPRRARHGRPDPDRRQRRLVGRRRRPGHHAAGASRRRTGVRRAALRERRGARGSAPGRRRADRGRRVDPPCRRPLSGARPRRSRHRGAQGAAARRGAGVPAHRRGHRHARSWCRSAVESSVGIAAGVALAAALPSLPYACGLATVQLLTDDVADPLLPVDGMLPVRGRRWTKQR